MENAQDDHAFVSIIESVTYVKNLVRRRARTSRGQFEVERARFCTDFQARP